MFVTIYKDTNKREQKQARVFPSGSILGAAEDTKSRTQNPIACGFAETEYLRRKQGAGVPLNPLRFFPGGVSESKPKDMRIRRTGAVCRPFRRDSALWNEACGGGVSFGAANRFFSVCFPVAAVCRMVEGPLRRGVWGKRIRRCVIGCKVRGGAGFAGAGRGRSWSLRASSAGRARAVPRNGPRRSQKMNWSPAW